MTPRKQLTREQAISLFNSGRWSRWTDAQRARFQLFQDRLCMPFDIFHHALEIALGRPIWTHEFADTKSLIDEWYGRIETPNMQAIIDKLPKDKPIILIDAEEKR